MQPKPKISETDAKILKSLKNLDKYPFLFFVNLFYRIVIPVTVGGMLVFVAVDPQHRIRKKIKKTKTAEMKK